MNKLTESEIEDELYNSSELFEDSSNDWEPSDKEVCSETDDRVSDDSECLSDENSFVEETNITDQNFEMMMSKDKNIEWSSEPPLHCGRFHTCNIISMTPGITRYAISRVTDELSAFILFFPQYSKQIKGQIERRRYLPRSRAAR